MFSLKNKLDSSLRYYISNNCYKEYRVIIKCNKFQKDIIPKILSLKGTIIHNLTLCGVIAATVSNKALDRLIEYPEISFIALDSYAFLCGMSVHTANNIKFSQKYKFTGRGVGIGLVDSGVYPHTDLLNPTNKIKTFVDLINGYKYPYDDNGHGTFISGLMCGSGYSSKGMYRGIAEKSDLHCYKAFNASGKGFISDILASIESIISLSENENIRILCLPFELLDNNIFATELFDKIFQIAISKNIIPLVPTGSNLNKQGTIKGIATSPNCITVGGLDTTKSPTSYIYSSCGPVGKLQKPDLLAACVNITSLNSDINYVSQRNDIKIYPPKLEHKYTTYSGTSCAVAYISALCAMLIESKPELNFNDVCSLFKISCESLDLPRYQEGNGIININKLFMF